MCICIYVIIYGILWDLMGVNQSYGTLTNEEGLNGDIMGMYQEILKK